ncbi:MAG: hypothetical protein R3C01_14435 [Planctomycetaceae bacterium]
MVNEKVFGSMTNAGENDASDRLSPPMGVGVQREETIRQKLIFAVELPFGRAVR